MAALFFVLSIVVRRGPEIHNPRDVDHLVHVQHSTEVRAGSARDFPADINESSTTLLWPGGRCSHGKVLFQGFKHAHLAQNDYYKGMQNRD